VIVGMDTELDTTPGRLGMDWAVRMEKPFFIGRASLERTAKLPDDRRWVGFTMDGEAPPRARRSWSTRRDRRQRHGQLDVAAPRQGADARLAERPPFPDEVEIDGRRAVVTPTPFYDPEGLRARA
jgi:sarcosine oxidase subunit alpha